MNSGTLTLFLLFIAALITASGQLLMKKGSEVLHQLPQHETAYFGPPLVQKVIGILLEPHIFLALVLYFLGMFLWLKILTRGDLSYLYPILISMTVSITSVSSVLLFKESFTAQKFLGIIFIVIGIVLILNFEPRHG